MQARLSDGSKDVRAAPFGVELDARCDLPVDPIEGEHRARKNATYHSPIHNNYVNFAYFEQGRDNVATDNVVWAPSCGYDMAVEGTDTCAPGACADNWSTADFETIPFFSDDPDSVDDYEFR